MRELIKHIKRELSFIGGHIPLLIFSAFIAAGGGVLLWINGGSSWYFIRVSSAGGIGLGTLFALSVISYAISGAAIALIWLIYSSGRMCCPKITVLFALAALSYLFLLVWYAVFFCTRLAVFALVILVLSCAADIVLTVFMRRTMITFEILNVFLAVLKVFFVVFSVSFL